MNHINKKQKNGLIRTIILTVMLIASAVFLYMHEELFADKRKIFVMYMAMILLTFIFVIATWLIQGRLQKKSGPDDAEQTGNRSASSSDSPVGTFLLGVMFLMTPPVLYVIIMKSYGVPFGQIAPTMFTYTGAVNLAVIGLICLLAYTLTRRLKAAIVISTLFNLVFALVNYALILFRSQPLMANDVLEVKTAAQVAGAYSFVFDDNTVSAVILSTLWITAALAIEERYLLKQKLRLLLIPLCIVCMTCFYTFVLSGDTLSEHHIKVSGWNPELSYKEHGYYISFLITFKLSIVEKPGNYSVAALNRISEKYKSDPSGNYPDKTTKKHPNIIVIMNESFSDMECFGKIKTNQEVIPFYKSLKDNTIKGTMHSSVYGGHTAVSEFEFLTGFSQRFMPLNSIPYTNIIGSFDVPSVTWNLKDNGYGGLVAFHPGRAGAYNRDIVYPHFGFSRYIASRDLDKNRKKIRDFNSDECDYDRLIEEYENYRKNGETKPYYMFNVTIQNHGGFTEDVGEVKPHQIDILDSKINDIETENFLNLMKISDDQLKRLITYFQTVKEPTVVMLFGDHQPRIAKNFYKVMNRRIGKRSSIERQENKFRTPFMIWANFDIKEEKDIDISANYLSSFMMMKLNQPMTGYQKYLMDLYKKVPVFTNICTIDKSGKIYAPEKKTPYDDVLEQYRCLQYNAITDNKHIVSDLFYLDAGE